MSLPQHLKQPKSLSIFFLTEMWERYGFYALQAGIIFFFTQHFDMSDQLSSAIIGTFIAMVYVTPVIGGFIADRLLGFKHTIILGGILLCLGYGFLAQASQLTHIYFFLGFICVGTGLLKANVSSLLGDSYEKHDPRRDSGFTIFYIGINLGTFISMLSSGFIIQYFGWHWDFAISAIGMGLGVFIFIVGIRAFGICNNQDITFSTFNKISAYLISALSIAVTGSLMSHTNLSLWVTIAASFLCILVILYAGFGENIHQKMRLLAILLLGILHCCFWAIFFQMFLSFNLFINRAVNTHYFGINFPPEFYMGAESFGVIAFGFAFSKLWATLSRTRFNPSTSVKFCISFGILSIAMLVLLISVSLNSSGTQICALWVIAMYFLVAFAELAISPIGLSMITRLSPAKHVGKMMGVWFFTLGIGGKLAGYLSSFGAIPHSVHQIKIIDTIYRHAFLKYFGICLCAFFIALIISPFITRLIRGPH